ncbi:MAG: hypothetical protein AUJ34_00770 [Parcubacteria group bacterium CG1_02_41_12]|nr:MAG: hypothetical protein AUJ34_00770 [Parcubacteria group bacterium CG1_02_41_12]
MNKCESNVNTGCYYYSPECKYLDDINKFSSTRDKAKVNLQKEIQYYENILDDISDKNNDYYTFVKRTLDILYIKKGRIDKNYIDYICNCTKIDDVFYIYSSDSYTSISEVNDNLSSIPKNVAEEVLCSVPGKIYDKELNKCVCDEGYKQDSNGECIEMSLMEKDNYCKAKFGEHSIRSYLSYQVEEITSGICICEQPNYVLNNERNWCVKKLNTSANINTNDISTKKNIISEEKNLITKIDKTLSKRVSGNILLQVEKNGEGWYVYPDNKKKYYLGRPADAFSIMRNLGLGIKHSELTGYLVVKFPSRLAGKILLDVEQNGEAYYVNPKDLKGYYLNRPADAFRIMRELGLGITNSDIRKIDVGDAE